MLHAPDRASGDVYNRQTQKVVHCGGTVWVTITKERSAGVGCRCGVKRKACMFTVCVSQQHPWSELFTGSDVSGEGVNVQTVTALLYLCRI